MIIETKDAADSAAAVDLVSIKDAARTVIQEMANEHKAKLAELEKRVYDAETKAARPRMPGVPGEASSGVLESPEVKAFADYARSGQVERKAMSIGSGPDGGVTVSVEMDSQITQLAAALDPIRGLARVVKAGTGEWTAVVATSEAAAEWRAETDTRNETATPTLAQIKPPSGEISCSPKLTRWLLNDSDFNLSQFVTEYVGRAFGLAEGAVFWNGTGTNQPKGLTAYTVAATADATRDFGTIEKLHSGNSGIFDGDDLIALLYKLAPAYRANAAWIVSAPALAVIRTLKAVDSGMYLFSPSLADGQPDRLLGRPIYESANVPVPAADAKAIWVGDFRAAYAVVDIGQPWMIRDEVTSKGNVILWTAKRVGGALLDSNAVKTLVLSA